MLERFRGVPADATEIRGSGSMAALRSSWLTVRCAWLPGDALEIALRGDTHQILGQPRRERLRRPVARHRPSRDSPDRTGWTM